MGQFITSKLNKGDYLRKIPAKFFMDVDEVLSNLEIRDGHIEKNGNSWVICPYSTTPADTSGTPGVTVSAITSFSVDTATSTLRYKKTSFKVLSKEAEDTGWTVAHTGGTC